MLLYEKIDASEGIDFKKSEKSKECMICHYCFFKDKNYNFERLVCDGLRCDLSVMLIAVVLYGI